MQLVPPGLSQTSFKCLRELSPHSWKLFWSIIEIPLTIPLILFVEGEGGGEQYQSKVPNRITQHDVEYRALATTLPLAEIQKFPQQLPLPIFTRGGERGDVRVKDNALKLNRKTQPEFEPTPLSLVPSTQATGPTPLKAHTRLY